ncbi:MAG: hypothetical protein LBM65_06155 [Oscillospiraceae bacterium]|nr:hypothetical protein [Oscillospiraceae bacterium]
MKIIRFSVAFAEGRITDPEKPKCWNGRIGIEISICGKCIEICPYTQKHLKERIVK